MNYRFSRDAGYSENIFKFEERLEEFAHASQEKVSESVKIGTLVDRVPQHVRQHLSLNMNENTRYEDLKTYLLRCEKAQRPKVNSTN